MKKLKKLLLSLACFALGAALTLVGTLAYLQDETDTAYNVMTSGNVKIEQLEYERNGDKLVKFKTGRPANPAVYNDPSKTYADSAIDWSTIGSHGSNYLFDDSIGNVVDHFVFVKNTGKNAAFYRTIIAIECPEDFDQSKIVLNLNESASLVWGDDMFAIIKGVRYLIKEVTAIEALPAGETSVPSLLQVYLAPNTVNEDLELFGDTFDVLVVSQAVQTEGFKQVAGKSLAETALDMAFGDTTPENTPWNRVNNPQVPEVPKIANNVAELRRLIAAGGSIVLADDMVLDSPIVVNSGVKVTIDLNGNDITYEAAIQNDCLFDVKGSLVINDNAGGKIEYTYKGEPDSSYGKGNYTIVNSGNLTINGGSIVNNTASMKHAFYTIDNRAGANLVINGGEVVNNNNYAIRQLSGTDALSNSIEINGGMIKGTRAIWMQLTGSSADVAPEMKLVVNDGSIVALGEADGYKLAYYAYSYGNRFDNVTVELNGGNISGDVALGGGTKNGGANVTVNFACNFSDNVYGQVYTYNSNDKLTFVVYNEEQLDYAMEQAETVKFILGADITLAENKFITVEKNLTIDLNTFTLTGLDTTSTHFGLINVANGAELTVNDTKGTGAIILSSTVNSGWDRYSSVISNQRGTLTVNGGTIEHKGGTDMSYAIDNLTNTNADPAKTVINGGVIKSTYTGIRQFCNSATGLNELTINGGVISGSRRSVWMQQPNDHDNFAKLTINGGTLIGDLTIGSDKFDVTVYGSTYALSIEALRNALNNGKNVTIYKDTIIDEDIVIPANFNGTLSLADCTLKSITNNSKTAKIVINGNVVINNKDGSAITGEVINISGNGTLTAIANGVHAYGIGGDNTETINISGITINEIMGGHAHGVGSDTGHYKDAPEGGAAIGSGLDGAVITLNKVHVVKAIGGSKSAGIGALYHTGVTVNIIDSVIDYVEGGVSAAGIGGSRVSNGCSENDTTIKISNSTVTAVGGVYGAGIGSGYDTHCQANQPECTINIENSTIKATGGKYAAGVGAGYHNAGLKGEIKNSTVTATSGDKFYKASYTKAQDIGFGVVDPAREGHDNDSFIIFNGTVIAIPSV